MPHSDFTSIRSFEERLQALPAHVVYGQLTGRPSWGEQMARLVPDHMQAGFTRFIAYGRRSNNGHFLRALINNDLMGAFSRADESNIANMRNWAMFLFNYAPQGSYGRPDAYNEWDGILSEYFEEDA